MQFEPDILRIINMAILPNILKSSLSYVLCVDICSDKNNMDLKHTISWKNHVEILLRQLCYKCFRLSITILAQYVKCFCSSEL